MCVIAREEENCFAIAVRMLSADELMLKVQNINSELGMNSLKRVEEAPLSSK